MINEALKKILIEEGHLSTEQAEKLFEESHSRGISFFEYLKERRVLDEKIILKTVAKLLNMEFRENIENIEIPSDFIDKVPFEFARRNQIVAIKKEKGIYYIATSRPTDFFIMDDLASMLDAQVEAVVVPTEEIMRSIDKVYQHKAMSSISVVDEIEKISEESYTISETAEDLLDIANRAPVIKLVNSVFTHALQRRASDIHFQPRENDLRIRFRIDGVLYDYLILPKHVQDAVISRIKVMSKLDIAEKRSTQDGRITLNYAQKEIDVRVSVVPTVFGEQIVLRLLDKDTQLYSLENLGLDEENLRLLDKMIHKSHGIIFVTGPTGSGKTTTLYAALSRLNTSTKNIITIEDPVEYKLEGISQIQVEPKKNITFATGLRAVLRQDPDILMVGEVRDKETATNAIQSALTGHLVFSTLHTNDSPSAITRMLDIGIEPYLVSSTVIMVMAQRLVRKICPYCKEAYTPDKKTLAELGLKMEDLPNGKVYRGRGCERCMNSGYYGRTGIYEIMVVNDKIQKLIVARADANEIKKAALENGMRTLRMDGAVKVKQGITTIEEVLQITSED